MRREAPAVRLRGFQGSANCSANCSAELLCLDLLLAVWLAGWRNRPKAMRRCNANPIVIVLLLLFTVPPSHSSTHTPLSPINTHQSHPPPLRAPQSTPKNRHAAPRARMHVFSSLLGVPQTISKRYSGRAKIGTPRPSASSPRLPEYLKRPHGSSVAHIFLATLATLATIA